MSIRGSRPGPLFITSDGLPVQSYHFATILKECIRSLGLNPQHYTSHGFRIGGASYAHQHNFSDAQLKRLGRWNSSVTQNTFAVQHEPHILSVGTAETHWHLINDNIKL